MDLLINNLKLSDEQLEAVEDLAGGSYSPEKIALYLDVPMPDFMREWHNHESELRARYNRGMLMVPFEVFSKQVELAKSGNITAAQIVLKENEKTNVDNVRKHCFFNQ